MSDKIKIDRIYDWSNISWEPEENKNYSFYIKEDNKNIIGYPIYLKNKTNINIILNPGKYELFTYSFDNDPLLYYEIDNLNNIKNIGFDIDNNNENEKVNNFLIDENNDLFLNCVNIKEKILDKFKIGKLNDKWRAGDLKKNSKSTIYFITKRYTDGVLFLWEITPDNKMNFYNLFSISNILINAKMEIGQNDEIFIAYVNIKSFNDLIIKKLINNKIIQKINFKTKDNIKNITKINITDESNLNLFYYNTHGIISTISINLNNKSDDFFLKDDINYNYFKCKSYDYIDFDSYKNIYTILHDKINNKNIISKYGKNMKLLNKETLIIKNRCGSNITYQINNNINNAFIPKISDYFYVQYLSKSKKLNLIDINSFFESDEDNNYILNNSLNLNVYENMKININDKTYIIKGKKYENDKKYNNTNFFPKNNFGWCFNNGTNKQSWPYISGTYVVIITEYGFQFKLLEYDNQNVIEKNAQIDNNFTNSFEIHKGTTMFKEIENNDKYNFNYESIQIKKENKENIKKTIKSKNKIIKSKISHTLHLEPNSTEFSNPVTLKINIEHKCKIILSFKKENDPESFILDTNPDNLYGTWIDKNYLKNNKFDEEDNTINIVNAPFTLIIKTFHFSDLIIDYVILNSSSSNNNPPACFSLSTFKKLLKHIPELSKKSMFITKGPRKNKKMYRCEIKPYGIVEFTADHPFIYNDIIYTFEDLIKIHPILKKNSTIIPTNDSNCNKKSIIYNIVCHPQQTHDDNIFSFSKDLKIIGGFIVPEYWKENIKNIKYLNELMLTEPKKAKEIMDKKSNVFDLVDNNDKYNDVEFIFSSSE